jgi:hypothetical protein
VLVWAKIRTAEAQIGLPLTRPVASLAMTIEEPSPPIVSNWRR